MSWFDREYNFEFSDRNLAGIAAVVAALVSVASLWNGFALDDVHIVLNNPVIKDLGDPGTILTSAYWRLPPADTLWRPLGFLAFAIQWWAGDGSPLVFHAVNVALYMAVTAAVFFFCREMLSSLGAWIAVLIFAVHPIHVESVGNVVGQLELVVALVTICACREYLRARRSSQPTWRSIAVIVALFVVGLGFKEHAVLMPVFFIAMELTVLRNSTSVFSRSSIKWRGIYYLMFAVFGVWILLRFGVLNGFAGERPHLALLGLSAVERFWVMLALVPEFFRLLLWPARLYADYSPQMVPIHTSPVPAHIAGALMIVAYLIVLIKVWNRSGVAALGLLWIPASLILVSNILLPTGILIAERTLFLATLGIALLSGWLAASLLRVTSQIVGPVRLLLPVSLGLLLLVGGYHSHSRQSVWVDSPTVVSSLVHDAPLNHRGFYWVGDALLKLGELREGEAALFRSLELWPHYEMPYISLGAGYQKAGLCEPAIVQFERALAGSPRNLNAYFGIAQCHFDNGRYSEARSVAFHAYGYGTSPEALRYIVILADSALIAHDSLASSTWWPTAR